MTRTLSCIIPAYNEARRIGPVLAAVARHPEIDEVIVVDDGSTDGTAAIVAGWPGVRLIRLDPNRGKTAALEAGLAAARGGLIMLIDADLEGLGAGEISALIRPARSGRAEMSVSLRANAPWLWRWIGIDYISGERVLTRELIDAVQPHFGALPRFGFEVFLNRQAVTRRASLAVVPWPAVRNAAKARKYGLWRGVAGDIGMLADMFRTCGPLELLGQIIAMRRLRVDPAPLPPDAPRPALQAGPRA